MSVKESIKNCFKELTVSIPYREISVSMICQKAAVSRTAFYDCYPNKEAVFSSIVEDDIITPQRLLQQTIPVGRIKSSPQILMELIYTNIKKDAEFYIRMNRVEHNSLLINALTEGFMNLNKTILEEYGLPADEAYYARYFFAVSDACLVSKWLENGLDVEPARLSQLYNKWTLRYWQDIAPVKMDWMQ